MAKFCGNVGFIVYEETKPGVYEEVVTEKKYYGDVLRNTKSYQNTDALIDDVRISNQISIIGNGYAKKNFAGIRYVEYMGVKWCVTNLDATTYPRIILTLGGVYNGREPENEE